MKRKTAKKFDPALLKYGIAMSGTGTTDRTNSSRNHNINCYNFTLCGDQLRVGDANASPRFSGYHRRKSALLAVLPTGVVECFLNVIALQTHADSVQRTVLIKIERRQHVYSFDAA